MQTNSPKCQELGWACTSLAVETYGNWGEVAQGSFSRLASHATCHQPVQAKGISGGGRIQQA